MQAKDSALWEARENQVAFDWHNPLLTDKYQLSMTYAYWKNGRQNEPVAFEAYFRKSPFKG